MKNKKIIIFFVIIEILTLIGAYFILKKDNNEPAAFLKLEKIIMKDEEKKVKVKGKELILKQDNGLSINDKKLEYETITNIYNTGDFLIICYQGTQKDKYAFFDNEGIELKITREDISNDDEFSNLRLDGNKLIADTNNSKVEIIYKEGIIIIKKSR